MKNFRKVLALVLALAMVLSMAGCSSSSTESDTDTSASSDLLSTLDSAKQDADSNAASATDTSADSTADTAEEASYTYNYADSTFPTLWSPHTYETSTDADICDYITSGFYGFDYNETLDGYKLVPLMAVAEPEDVTNEYIGSYGLTAESYSQAWKITLRQDIKWQDGTGIVAEDFVESAKRLLDPNAQNYRADSLYNGNMVIYNAQNYLYGGKDLKVENAANAYYTMADLTLGDDGVYVTPDGGKVYWAIDYTLEVWLGGETLAAYVAAYGDSYFDITNWDTLLAMADEDGLVPLTDETYQLFAPVTTGNPNWGETEDDLPAYWVYESSYPLIDFDEVGIFTTGDYELVLVLTKPLSGFYLLYSLGSSWLVNTELYDSCASYVDGVYTNTYGTSVETTISYGPYMLTSFQADKQYVLEKNPYYFELNDDTEYPIYQTTKLVCDYVPEASTRLELLLQGKLDTYGLTKDDMETYSRSDNCYYTPGDSTYFMAINPNFEALESMQAAAGENINKTILTIKEFRMALSFALNRADFCLATSPTNNAALALYSDLIISDPENGVAYRTTDQAKNVIANFWDVADEYGDGKLYADIDEAIDSITGYNLSKAQEYFNIAYDKAIELGYMDEDDVVEIEIGLPSASSTFYNSGYDYLVNCYTEAVKGTKLEGKLTFTRDDTIGNDFATALQTNLVDMLFGVGWTGSALDPYGLMEAYTSSTYQYDPAWDTTATPLTISIYGVDYTTDVWSWTKIMSGEVRTITAADGSTMDYSCGDADDDPEGRLNILAAIENAILLQYDAIPMMDASSAGLKGMQIKYFTENYVFGMGRGGIKYYTYNYTDAEWDAYVASQGGTLDYK